jgi:hypothetical protein
MSKKKIIECMTGKTVEEWEKSNSVLDKLIRNCSNCGSKKECREYGALCTDNMTREEIILLINRLEPYPFDRIIPDDIGKAYCKGYNDALEDVIGLVRGNHD